MQKFAKNVLLLLAVVTVIAHSILPHVHMDDIVGMMNSHHHHESSHLTEHHHEGDGKENHQPLFSFAQLDEDFIPAKEQVKKCEPGICFVAELVGTLLSETFIPDSRKFFGNYEEYPPPGNHHYNLPSRAPPAICIS